MDTVRSNILADLDSYLNGNNPGAGVMNRARTANTNTYDWINALGAPKKSAAPTEDHASLFWKALEGIGGTSKILTNPIADITDSSKGGTWVDRLPVAIGNTLTMGAKAQVKDWLDGQLSWGDIPGFGALYGFGSQGKGFDATLKNTGAGEGVQKWGGFAGDMVLDPLNFLTLGGSSALKAGKAAMGLTAGNLAKDAGVAAGRKAAQRVPEAIYDATVSKYAGSAVNPNLVDRLAAKKFDNAFKAIQDSGKSARAGAQNALFNFDVPLTKITKQFGTKPGFLQKTENLTGAVGKAAAANALAKVGIETEADVSKFLKKQYGTEDLNMQQLADLQKQVDGIGLPKNLPDFNIDEKMQTIFQPNLNKTVDYNRFNPDELLGQLDPRIASRVEGMVRGLGGNGFDLNILNKLGPEAADMLGAALPKMPGGVKGKTADAVQQGLAQAGDLMKGADQTASIKFDPFTQTEALIRKVSPKTNSTDFVQNALKQMDSFVQDAGGKSAVGRAVGNKNPFDARSFKSAEPMVNKSAGDIRDAETKMFGQSRQMDRVMQRIAAKAEQLTPAERDMLPHILEGAIPKSKSLTGMSSNVMQVASDLKNILQVTGKRDFQAGTVKDLINNYFPHVLKQSDGDIASILKKYADDPVIKKVLTGSQANNFGKTRTSFDNLAQLDDHVSTLQTKLNGMPDGEAKIALQEKIDTLQNLFERDPIKAVSSRVYKSIRSSAMADLFKQFSRDGLLVRSGEDPARAGGYKRLNAEEAKKLGLKENDRIHKEVYEGMQKVKDLVTDKGVQNFLDKATGAINIWKSLVTSYVPAHYFYNFVGNISNNTMAGVGISSYKEAGTLLSKSKAGTLSGEEAKFMQDAVDKGVIGQGFSADFIKSPFDKAEGLADKVNNTAYAKAMRNGGDAIDDFSRLALFRHGYDQTGSVDKAAEMVRKYLFNYHEQSNADKYMRLIAPFWMWTKNNVPLQMQEFFRQPRFFSTYHKLQSEFNADQKGNMPGWMQESYVNIPGTKYAMNPRLPLSDLNMAGSGNGDDAVRSLLGMLNPLMKMPFEVGLNKQAFNGNPIDWNKTKPEDSYDPAALGKYGLNQLGLVGKVGNLVDGGNILDALGLFIGKPAQIK